MDENEMQEFEDMAIRELDACGYFLMEENRTKAIDKMIMDFACLYCMERYGKSYTYNIVETT